MKNTQLEQIIEELKKENAKLKQELQELQQDNKKQEAKLLFEIQKVSNELNKKPIKKTGYNKFQKYHYYELDDIIPYIDELLVEHELSLKFFFTNTTATLTITNLEGTSTTWETPMKQFNVEKTNGSDVGILMKREQSLQTYARRTLLLQAFNISEPNEIEQENTDEKVEQENTDEKVDQKKHITTKQKEVPKKSAKKATKKTKTLNEIYDNIESSLERAGLEVTTDNITKRANYHYQMGTITEQQKEDVIHMFDDV